MDNLLASVLKDMGLTCPYCNRPKPQLLGEWHDCKEADLVRSNLDLIEESIQEGLDGRSWTPTNTDPIKRRHEIKDHNTKLDTARTQALTSGLEVNEDYELFFMEEQ